MFHYLTPPKVVEIVQLVYPEPLRRISWKASLQPGWQIQVWQPQFGTPAAAIGSDVFGDSGRLTWHFTFSRDGAWTTCGEGASRSAFTTPASREPSITWHETRIVDKSAISETGIR